MKLYWNFLNWWSRYWENKRAAYHLFNAVLIASIWYFMPLAMNAVGIQVDRYFDLKFCLSFAMGYFLMKHYFIDTE